VLITRLQRLLADRRLNTRSNDNLESDLLMCELNERRGFNTLCIRMRDIAVDGRLTYITILEK
jgi:hypothetical protein